jgi:hypothetical protein
MAVVQRIRLLASSTLRLLVSSILIGLACATGAGASEACPPDMDVPGQPSLATGYRLMYGLDFGGAEREFVAWQHQYPRDAMGPMSAAANILFAELDRLGILRAQFFVNDDSITSRQRPSPDAGLHSRFEPALARAEVLAGQSLARDPNDRDSLLAMALVNGLRADYAALIEGRNLAALPYTRQAARWAARLIALEPECGDAYLATGISQYIIGSLAAPVRWILRLGGYAGDKQQGMQNVARAARDGRYLGPFARILLAIAYLRDGDRSRARGLLAGLARDFPSNPLFASEIRRLDTGHD